MFWLNAVGTSGVWSYTLNYKPDPANPNATGQFNKSLLRSIAQLGTDGITTFNQHSFTYFDDIGNGNDATPGGGGSFDPTNPGSITAFGASGSGNVPGGIGTLSSGSGFVGDVNGTAFSGAAVRSIRPTREASPRSARRGAGMFLAASAPCPPVRASSAMSMAPRSRARRFVRSDQPGKHHRVRRVGERECSWRHRHPVLRFGLRRRCQWHRVLG